MLRLIGHGPRYLYVRPQLKMTSANQKTDAMNWKKWVNAHGDAVICLGLPADVLNDRKRWRYFLEHGYDHTSGWKPQILPMDQMKSLMLYLKAHVAETNRSGLVKEMILITGYR